MSYIFEICQNGNTTLGILNIRWSGYVIMVVADILMPNMHQTISNHDAD